MQIAQVLSLAAEELAKVAHRFRDFCRTAGLLRSSGAIVRASDRTTVLANRKANVRRMRGLPNAKKVRKARRAKYRSMAA